MEDDYTYWGNMYPNPSHTIKTLRKLARMNQQEFADYLGMNVRTIRSWEQGTRNPSKGVVQLIQRALFAEKVIVPPDYSDFAKGFQFEPKWNKSEHRNK